MNEQELNTLLNSILSFHTENEVVEFKEAKENFDFNKLGKYFSALSNEANLKNVGYAWLVFGIEDKNKEIVGTNYRLRNLQKLKYEIAEQTNERTTFQEIYEINYKNKRIVLFQIAPASVGIPLAFQGHYYGREHDSLVALSISKLEQIRKQIKNSDWSANVCYGATIDDLDSVAIEKARENFKVKNPRLASEIDTWDNNLFLKMARITKNDLITNTAIILLGKPESMLYLSPSTAQITWILKDKNNMEKDYKHFSCPFLLSAEELFYKIRNLKYRYIKDESIFPDEVDQYAPFIIREALNNCIAHQDYKLNGRINVIENEDAHLIFTNLGSFFPGNIENVINQEAPPEHYRNNMLVQAMENLNMIDTIGSGIKRMFRIQKEKLFPLPDYVIEENRVSVKIIGKVIDLEYARVLAKNHELSLYEIFILDKVQKHQPINDSEIKILRTKKLIEGRKPNFYISKSLAQKTEQKAKYIQQKGLDKKYYKEIILDYLKKFDNASRVDLENLLFSKLPDVLNKKQKSTKIKHILTEMHKIDHTIQCIGKGKMYLWFLKK